MKQVVRSLSTWMQTLIPTNTGKPTRRKGSVRLKTNAGECLELRTLPAALIGVDFGPADGSPKNWKNFGGSTNGTVAKLTDESGVASNVSLDIKYADGEGGEVSPTFAAAQLPKHSQSLAGLDGAIRDNSKITLTFNNLTASGLYEVYVFGGTTKADSQSITLAGSGQSQTFSQILDPGKLVVNSLAGSSSKDLSAYAKKVTATSSGQITISAEGVELPECSLAGVAIRPVVTVVPDIQMNSVKSDGESTLTVQYTIKNAAVKPFRIAAYSSEDSLFSAANDRLAGFVQISSAADLTPGQHTKTYKIGQQIKLPNAGATATNIDHLLFVADDNKLVPEDDKDPFNEDNKSVFSGAYVGNGTLSIVGSSGNDTITLANAGQTLNVSSANVNRTYTAKIDRVYVFAGGGIDNVTASRLTVPITVEGGAGNDRLTGGSSSDSLSGGAGNDSLEGKDGNDVLFGGDGNDFITGNDGNDKMYGQEGDDRMWGDAGNDYMLGHAGNDEMYGSQGNDEISGNAGNDRLSGDDGNDTLFGSEGNDEMYGSKGDDEISGNAGNDRLSGDDGNDTLFGSEGDDSLEGNGGDDVLEGHGGDDRMIGGDGNDKLSGGLGSDLYEFDNATSSEVDTVDEKADQGSDTLDFSRLAASAPVGVDLRETTIATHKDRTVRVGSDKSQKNWENVLGSPGDDTIAGNDADNRLEGLGGNDRLEGNKGNDDLIGGIGNDHLVGGLGSDVYEFGIASSSEQDTVDEKAEPGVDTLDFSRLAASSPVIVDLRNQSLGDTRIAVHENRKVRVGSADSLKNWENVFGTPGNDFIIGNDVDNRPEGLGGNDELRGHEGNDYLNGGLGNDELSGHDGSDILVGGAGADLIVGGENEDLLISGTAAAFDTEAGRLAVIQVWSSTKTLSEKAELLRSGVGTAKASLKRGDNVKDDGSQDTLKKGGGVIDWVFYRAVDDTFTSGAGDILELL